jgi:hypothetical protein
VAVDGAGEHVGEIGLGLDVVEFAGLDEGGEDGPVLAAPPSEPANAAFLRLRAMGRMARSTVLQSRSMRPS